MSFSENLVHIILKDKYNILKMRYNINKCYFKHLPPFTDDPEFQEICDVSIYNTLILMILFTPIVYLLILQLEKKYSKNKFKKL